ncbi:MAG: PAS domain S-box protein [Bacteroidota bacterium]
MSEPVNNYSRANLYASARDIEDFFDDRELKEVIDEIRSSYPFTFLTKGKIQYAIDGLGGYFWLEDPGGNYLLVNSKFANSFGLRPQQLEGKNELEMLPVHLKEFYKSVKSYILTTQNVVIKEGFAFPVIPAGNRIVEFPLCNMDNEVIAVIGFSQASRETAAPVETAASRLRNIAWEKLPAAVLLLDAEGMVRSVSTEYGEFFASKGIREGINIRSVVDESAILDFINQSAFFNEEIEIRQEVTFDDMGTLPLIIKLKKVFDSVHKLLGFIAVIEKDFAIELKKLNYRETMYDILMQTSPDPIFIYNTENLKFLDVNTAAIRLYGYSRDEFLEMDLTDLYAPEDIQTLLHSDNLKSENFFSGPWRHRKKDGTFVYVEISKSGFEFEGQSAQFNIVRDISEKTELRRKAAFFENAFDSISDLLFVSDSHGFILKCNKTVSEVLGYDNDALYDRSFVSLVSDAYRQTAGRMFMNDVLLSGETVHSQLKKVSGEVIDFSLQFLPLYDDSTGLLSGMNIIGKPMYKSDEHIAGQRTDESTSSRPQTAAASSESSPLDSKFLSGVFHEILTPINVILGFSQELTDSVDHPSAEQAEAAEIIKQNSELLLQTMDSVMEYTQIEQNLAELKPERISFTSLLDQIQSATKKISDSKKVEFSYGKISSSLTFETDRTRFEEFVSILVSMSMLITRQPSVFISAYQWDDGNFIISIKDDRRAASPVLVETLRSFFTSDENNIKKEFGISRLRVRLARKLLKLLNGEIKFVLKGTEVNEVGFVFPLQMQMPELKSAPKQQPGEFQPLDTESADDQTADSQTADSQTADRLQPPASAAEQTVQTWNREVPDRDQEEKTAYETLPPVRTEKGFDHTADIQPPAATAETAKTRLDLSRYSCLYLEDQIDSQILFKVQLKEFRKLDLCVSLEDALPLLENNHYDIIVLDMNLQGEYNGLDALRIIRQMPHYSGSIILAVTAYVLPGDKDKFIAAGFNGFISKPIMKDKLVKILENTLPQRK